VIGGIALANLIAVLAVILVCFVAGLAARHALAGKFVKILELKVLMKVPGYSMVKGLASGFDASATESLKQVALQLGTAERIGFEMQKLPSDQVTYLNVPATRIIEITENYGHGVGEILPPKAGPDDCHNDDPGDGTP